MQTMSDNGYDSLEDSNGLDDDNSFDDDFLDRIIRKPIEENYNTRGDIDMNAISLTFDKIDNAINNADDNLKERINDVSADAQKIWQSYPNKYEAEKVGLSLIRLVIPNYQEGDKIDERDVITKLLLMSQSDERKHIIKLYEPIRDIFENEDWKSYSKKSHEFAEEILQKN